MNFEENIVQFHSKNIGTKKLLLDFLLIGSSATVEPCLLKSEGGGPWSAIQASAPGRRNPQVLVGLDVAKRSGDLENCMWRLQPVNRMGYCKIPTISTLLQPVCSKNAQPVKHVEQKVIAISTAGGVLDLVVFYRILGFGTSQLFHANVHLGQSRSNCQNIPPKKKRKHFHKSWIIQR